MNYCIGAIFNKELNKVLLLKKDPKNLKDKELSDKLRGKLNFIGGKIDNNELPLISINRECKEETGLNLDFTHFVTIQTNHGNVYCFYCITEEIYNFKQIEHEELKIYGLNFWSKESWYKSFNHMSNLDWLIPMALNHANSLDSAKSFEIKEMYE